MTADRVAPGIYVGSLTDAADSEALRDAGIETIVGLTHAAPDGGYPEEVAVHGHPMMDGPRNEFDAFRSAVEAVLTARERDETVLVHCSAGASRSVSVAAAALAVRDGLDVREAFVRVGERRPAADPHPALVRRATRLLDER